MHTITKQAETLLEKMRKITPLVHQITNYVTVNDCANITLAIGASPIMADDMDEAAAITAISSALVLNIGTLNKRTIASMLAAGKRANECKIPIILDPVGAGASQLRNQTVKELLTQVKVSVIRGNMSEIRFIAGLSAETKGVDASESDLDNSLKSSIDTARDLSAKLGCVIAITGATDIVSDGSRTVCIKNGHKMLRLITGTGCMCTSLIGSFHGITKDSFAAAVSGILCMSIAGEIAYENAGTKGNGSYHMAILDEISKLNPTTIRGRANVNEV